MFNFPSVGQSLSFSLSAGGSLYASWVQSTDSMTCFLKNTWYRNGHMPTYFEFEFNRNRRIGSKMYGHTIKWNILRPGKTQAGMEDTEAEIRDIPGNTGWLASLVVGQGWGEEFWILDILLLYCSWSCSCSFVQCSIGFDLKQWLQIWTWLCGVVWICSIEHSWRGMSSCIQVIPAALVLLHMDWHPHLGHSQINPVMLLHQRLVL